MQASLKYLMTAFAADRSINRESYLRLLSHILSGYLRFITPDYSGSDLPGTPSGNGKKIDCMEAFSRLAPALAATIYSSATDSTALALPGFDISKLQDILASAYSEGCNPSSTGYWGELDRGGQCVCEASDLAIALWISKDWLPDALGQEKYGRLLKWLAGGCAVDVKDNNWNLFPATIAMVLSCLGEKIDTGQIQLRLNRVHQFENGDGLFIDGIDGPVDTYTAWGFHYNLGMMEWISNGNTPKWICDSRSKACNIFSHFVGPEGWPVFGRSIHYRMAITAPLSVDTLNSPRSTTHATVTRRALDVTWSYFIRHGAIDNNKITQGYWHQDADLVEGYSGPGSPLWSLRSLIPLLLLPKNHVVWDNPMPVLPIDLSDYEIPFGKTGWLINGCNINSRIMLKTNCSSTSPFKRPNILERMKSIGRGVLYRPANYEARYARSLYLNAPPFFVNSL